MESIISLIIEESDDDSQYLSSTKLADLKQIHVTSLDAYSLVNNVIKQCERKLKSFLIRTKLREEEKKNCFSL